MKEGARVKLLLAVEALFVLLALAGVWFVFWPAALILGGVAGVVACERASVRLSRSEASR